MKIIIIILTAVVAAGLAGGGIYWWQNNQTQALIAQTINTKQAEFQRQINGLQNRITQLEEENKTLQDTLLEEATLRIQQEASANKEGDLQVCRNIKYGYEIKYPVGWKVYRVGPPEASETTCDENLDAFGFSPNIYDANQPVLAIIVSNAENLEQTVYKGSQSLDDYFAKNPAILEHQQIIKETTLDNERLVWLSDGTLSAFHNNSLFEFTNIKNIDDDTLDLILRNFKFIE